MRLDARKPTAWTRNVRVVNVLTEKDLQNVVWIDDKEEELAWWSPGGLGDMRVVRAQEITFDPHTLTFHVTPWPGDEALFETQQKQGLGARKQEEEIP